MKRIQAEGLFNTRDLGEMRTADGRKIRSGLLFRSGMLAPATENDLTFLRSLGLTRIIDFRAPEEIQSKPDPEIAGAEKYFLPADDNLGVGLRRDEEAERQLIEIVLDRVAADPDYAVEYMQDMYRRLASSPHSVSVYRNFIHLVLENETGVTLWHCTAGKDRAGFASVIVEKILGVDDEVILADYLYTNECMEDELNRILVMLKNQPRALPEKALRQLFGAESSYFYALYDAINDVHGGWDAFLKNGLSIGESEIRRLRDRYLID